MSLSILFQDERLIVVDKPARVLSVRDASSGTTSVPELLARQGVEAFAVHRLDRDVSGVLLLARDAEARDRLQDLFRARELQKIYWALAAGWIEPPAGKLSFPILEERGSARVSARGKPARTLYTTLARHSPGAGETGARIGELELELVTGRKNQIRVHLAHAGHPLLGERKYAAGRESPLAPGSRRIALHAARFAFVHLWPGDRRALAAPLPADLAELRARAAGSDPPR